MAIQVNRFFFEKGIVTKLACDWFVEEDVKFLVWRGFFKEFQKILFLFLADFEAVQH